MDFSFSVQAHLFPAVVFLFAVAIGIELKVSHFGVLRRICSPLWCSCLPNHVSRYSGHWSIR